MMNNAYTGAIVTLSIRPIPLTPITLIMKQSATAYTPPAGDSLVMKFDTATYTPPII